jgi:tRNA A-37 threonylcarbamoyl transferase component Bud32
MSVTEFVNLILDATVGRVVLEHAESLRYPHEDLFTGGLISLLRLGVPPRGQELSAPPAAPRARDWPATRGRGESASIEPFPADPNLPHLEAAKDPERMREVFQGHLRSLGEEAHQVRECEISRIRYRRADCSVQYALRLAEPGTGRERSQLVTGTMFAGGRTRQMWEKLRRSEPERETPDASSPAFEPFFYIPQLDMLVEVFPYDRELPALPRLVEGPPSELEPLLLARFGPGDWRFEAWDVEPVKYLPERRATLRLTARAREAQTGRAEERRFYAKVYSDGETGERIHRVTRALWEKAGAGGERFTVARPIAYLGDGRRTLIQEEAPGTLLRDRILSLEEDATPAVRKTARALAVLHLDHVVDHVVTPRRTHLQKEVANMERIGELLRPNCPHLGPRIEEIVGAVVAGLEEGVPAPTHGDFKPDNILLDGDRLALLDFDEFTEADPVQDAARFLAHLTAMPLSFALPHDRARAYARAFAEEYFAHVPEAWRDRLPLHYARNVFKMAPNFLQRPQPGWPDKIEALIEEAEDSLAGRVW